jgi:hypothetical protein
MTMSNMREIITSPPLAHARLYVFLRVPATPFSGADGRLEAGKGARTPDLRVTNAVLYQLSYPGAETRGPTTWAS